MSVAKFKANAEAEQYDTKTYLKAMNSKVIYFNQNPVTKKHDIKIERPIELASKIITKGWDRNCNVKQENNQYTQLCFQDLVSSYKTLPARFRALHKKLLRRGSGDESGTLQRTYSHANLRITMLFMINRFLNACSLRFV